MSYEKKTWVNNQTKLNATNMNRLEGGVEEANSLAAQALDTVDAINTKLTTLTNSVEAVKETSEEALEKADSVKLIADSATELASEAKELSTTASTTATKAKETADLANTAVIKKQDILVSGTSIKTVNGESLLGAGDIKVATDINYKELSEASLNDMKEQGVYKIAAASDVPETTAASGTLHVNTLDSTHYEQLWYSDSNWGRRIVESDSPAPTPTETYTLIINGTSYTSNNIKATTVSLQAGAEYDVSGDLYGHIEILSATTPAGPTKIRLKGVNILSDSDSGIVYAPENKKLVIEVFADTSNYINVANGKEKDDAAALLSNSDITITGTGFLGLSTNLGHAIKGSEVVVNGEPDIQIAAVHDAFHASKLLRITGGHITVDSCNDVFSAGSADSPDKITVEMTITGGRFIIKGATDSLFQNKSTVGNCRIIRGDFSVSNAKEMFQEETGGTKIAVYDLCNWYGLSEEQEAEVESRTVILADQYEDCKVWYVSADSGESVTIEPLGTEYSLNGGDEISYNITGNITGKQFITTNKKVNINLKGVYCDETDESGTILFDYQNVKSRLQINVTEGYINYIKKNSGVIFHSNSNLALKLKESDATDTVPQKISIGFFSAPNGTVMNAYCESTSEPSRAAIAGDGICYIIDSKIGVYADNLWLGNEYGDNGEADWGKAYISLYLKSNETDTHLIWKETDEPKKAGYIYAPWYLLGTCIIGSNLIYSDESKKWFEAPSGTVDASYINTPIVYTTADISSYAINTNIVTYKSTFNVTSAKEFNLLIATVSAEYGEWVVYKAPDNVYTKEEVDAIKSELAEKTNALEGKVTSLTPKYATISHDENISEIKVFRWYGDNGHEADEDAEIYSTPVLARDGDFGYPSIDGTGQINFMPTFLNDYQVASVSVSPAGAYKNIKLPAETGVENLYRITKVNSDISISLTATTYPVTTFNWVLPENYAGEIPTITIYKTSEEIGVEGKGTILNFIDNTATDYLYNKDTGIRTIADGDTAQVHLVIGSISTEGYTVKDPIISAGKAKNFKYDDTTGEWKATKVSEPLTITFEITAA